MKTPFAAHPWKLVETELPRNEMRLSESLMSIGNAHIGIRGSFEEAYGGDCRPATYLAGVWFPAKVHADRQWARQPEYSGKLIHAANLLEIGLTVGGEEINLSNHHVTDYYRELDMRHGLLRRRATVHLAAGTVRIEVERFLSIRRKEILAIRYRVIPSFAADVVFAPALDVGVQSEGGECLWESLVSEWNDQVGRVIAQTRENPFGSPRFTACAAMWADMPGDPLAGDGRVACHVRQRVAQGTVAELIKLVSVDTSRHHAAAEALKAHTTDVLLCAAQAGYEALRDEQCADWLARWDSMDITIEHDIRAQQGIRYSLFQTLCSYDGTDATLGIGPNGLTGEKHGVGTRWEAEMFCLPMILSTLGEEAGKNLLKHRYLQLDKAKENAARLGCEGALYPMATFDGTESCGEWEAASAQIHRNAAVLYAIFMEHASSGGDAYLRAHGMPVMLEICRYWLSRMSFSERKRCYVILGVTGPNDYESNVFNNWYTNRMAQFCLEQTAQYARSIIGVSSLKRYGSSEREIARFERIAKKIYLPEDKKLGIFLQNDGFLQKEINPADQLPASERPLHRHWPRDRILRSCYIRQADVLQGLYCLRHLYDEETIRRNFSFYEPITVHEGSFSACVHAVLAADLSLYEKAMALFHKAARLDLDNIDGDTENGLHITSMAGSWAIVVKGFAGVRTENGCLEIKPHVPWAFRSLSFKLRMQGRQIDLSIRDGWLHLTLRSGAPLMVLVYDHWLTLAPGEPRRAKLLHQERAPR